MSERTVVVSHPGRQHSHQAALALEKHGLLAGYWSGVPAGESWGLPVPASWRRRWLRYAPVPIAPERLDPLPWAPALRRLGDALGSRGIAQRVDFAACRLFDRAVARRFARSSAGAIVACEISARSTFEVARRDGRLRLLDAPSIHHTAQDRLHGFAESPSLHRRIVAVKDAEIALADHVLTVSELARGTYLEAGLPPERVHAIPLGADLELFGRVERRRPEGAPVRFVFAGAGIRRKAFDLLVEAFAAIAAEVPGVELLHVGPRGDLGWLADRLPPSIFRATGQLLQSDWAEELGAADCLVLPSRNDSYGMVMAEALAAGLPVVVSTMVGAKGLVDEGQNGWLVPVDDLGALVSRLRWCALHPQELRTMSAACRQVAARATWEAFHERYAALVAELLERGRR